MIAAFELGQWTEPLVNFNSKPRFDCYDNRVSEQALYTDDMFLVAGKSPDSSSDSKGLTHRTKKEYKQNNNALKKGLVL